MRKTVLVAEDDALIRLDICTELADAGFDVVEAANVTDAITILERADKVDAVFTDVEMPGGLDGLEFSSIVHDRWPQILILVTSGRTPLTKNHLPDGAEFVPKPYISSNISRKLLAALAGPSDHPPD